MAHRRSAMKISEATAQDKFAAKNTRPRPPNPARHSTSDDSGIVRRKVLRVNLQPLSSGSDTSAAGSSSSGSSPSTLKKRLQQLPKINEFTLLVDRVSALSRRISRNVDFASLQERTGRIEENVEKEEREAQEQARRADKKEETDIPPVFVDESPKVEVRGARARRRAKIRLESLQAENLAVVISQPEEIGWTRVTNECKDEKESERKSCGLIVQQNPPTSEVSQFSMIEPVDFDEVALRSANTPMSSTPAFAENLPESKNSVRSEQIPATPIDYSLRSFRSEGQGDSMKTIHNPQSPYSLFTAKSARPKVFGGYRPKPGVVLKNLSSASESETPTETARNPFPSSCQTSSPILGLEMMSPMSAINPADGPTILPVSTARSDRCDDETRLYPATKSVPEKNAREFLNNSWFSNVPPRVTTRSEPPRMNDENLNAIAKTSPYNQMRSLSTRQALKEHSTSTNARRRLFRRKPMNHSARSDCIESKNTYSENYFQDKYISNVECGCQNDQDNVESAPKSLVPSMGPAGKTAETFLPSFTDNVCFSGRSAASMPTDLFHGRQHFAKQPPTLSTDSRANFSATSMVNNTEYHDSTDVTDAPTPAFTSQEMSYPASTGSREFSGGRPLDANALIRALSNVSVKQEQRDMVDDNCWEGNGDANSSAMQSERMLYADDSDRQKSMGIKSWEMSSVEYINSMGQSPVVPPIPEISGLVSEEQSRAVSRKTEENPQMGSLINEKTDLAASQLRSIRSKVSRLNLSSTERTDVTYRIENLRELASDGSATGNTLTSECETRCNCDPDQNERLPSWISARSLEENSSPEESKVKRIKLGTQAYQINKSTIVENGKSEYPSIESEEDVKCDREDCRKRQSEHNRPTLSDEETDESRQSSKLAERISTILNESMKKSNFSRFRSPETAKVQSETLALYCQRLHDISAAPVKMSTSAPKLNYSFSSRKDSPTLHEKSQDRLPYTISASPSVKSMKFQVMPVSAEINCPDEESKSPETSYKLEHHPSITRLAYSGLEETPAEILSCASQVRIESKHRLMPKMRGFVKRLLKRNHKRSSDEIAGPAKVIYKNSKCQEDSAADSQSEDTIDNNEVKEIERLSPLESPVKDKQEHSQAGRGRWTTDSANPYSPVISSGKTLKQKTSLEHISVRSESPLRRFDRDDMWVKASQNPEIETHRSSHKSSGRLGTDRYSIFLAKTGSKTSEPLTSTPVSESREKCRAGPEKKKSEVRKNIDDDFYRDSGCMCFRLCRLLTSTPTIPSLNYQQSVKGGSSFSRRRRRVRNAASQDKKG